jgi:hypothetical protein
MWKILTFVFGIVCVLLLIVVAAGGVVVVADRPQVIHALSGKTGAEYSKVMGDLDKANGQIGDLQGQLKTANGQIDELNKQINTLNSTIAGLQGQIGSWNALVCSHTWAEFVTPNELTFWNDLPNGIFSSMGFELYATQWKPVVVDPSKPFTTLILDVKANIVWDVTDHCIIMKKSVSGPSA